MARYKGKNGALQIGATDVAEMESFDIEMSVNEIDANVMNGAGWSDVCAGLKSASGSVSALTDPADPGQALFVEGDIVAATFYPTGNTTGLLTLAGNIMITSVGYTTAVGDLVKTTYNFRNSGEITRSVVA